MRPRGANLPDDMSTGTESSPSTSAAASSANPAWCDGAVVGRNTLLTRLAPGGMGEIWLARQSGLKGFEKVVVVKRILDTYCQDPEFVEMFLDEARIAAQLSHPNIVQIYDLGEHAGAYYIAMEYLAGEMLSRVVRAGLRAGRPPPWSHVARLLASAAEGLGYAHAKKGLDGQPLHIVHRDVSPQNLMVTYDGVIKVLDFGIAKASGRATSTGAGKFKGKTSYMAPEQVRGGEIDGRADVFALGVVLWELLARARLFQFDDPLAALHAIVSPDPIPSPLTRNPEAPPELAAIALRALERKPERRYASATEFAGALEDWLKTQPDAPGHREVSEYLRGLFAERMSEQSKMIEQARSEDVHRVRPPSEISVESSMPGSRSGRIRGRSRVRITRALFAGVFALAAAGAAGWWGSGGRAAQPSARRPMVLPELSYAEIAVPSVLEVATEPPGALVRVDGEAVGPSPAKVEGLGPGRYRITASLEGHGDAEQEVAVQTTGDRMSVLLQLAPVGAGAAPSGAPAAGDTVATTASAGPGAPGAPNVEPASATVKTKATRGRLTLTTLPWTEVYVGAKKLGETPLVDHPLPAGTWLLRLVNAQKGIDQRMTVEIKAGERTALRKSFQ